MKAWIVSDYGGNSEYSAVIFAETRGKAIRYALDYCDGTFDSFEWTEMRAVRVPALDEFYRGKPEMDWFDMDDRVAMVRYAGFYCSDVETVTVDKCKQCPAHFWCDRFESLMR